MAYYEEIRYHWNKVRTSFLKAQEERCNDGDTTVYMWEDRRNHLSDYCGDDIELYNRLFDDPHAS